MRISKLKMLGGLIALTLIMCLPSFGGIVTDNLGAQPDNSSPSGTDGGNIDLAQRFLISDHNTVDYTSSSFVHGLGEAWTTSYGTAFLMQLVFDDDTHNLTSATLKVVNEFNGGAGLPPTVRIYSDVFNSFDPYGPGPEPGTPMGALTTNTNPFPTTYDAVGNPMGPTNVTFTASATDPINLVEGSNYWLVLSSPEGVGTEWAYTGAPEPTTLALVGCALLLLSLRRKRC